MDPDRPSVGDAPSETDDDHGLVAALRAHPEARVTAIDPSGHFCPMPPELGSTHEVMEGETFFDVMAPSSAPRIIAGWQRAQQYGHHAGTLIDRSGDEVTVLAFDARDRFGVMVVLVLPDATIGATSGDEHRPVTSRFGTYHRDVLAAVINVDKGAGSLLGWTREDLTYRAGRDLIHPDDQANAEDNWLSTLLAPGEPCRWRGRHLHADGTWRWLEFTNTNRLEDLGHVVSEMMDISEEMATAQALRRRDELLARLNDALPVGVLEIDRDRRVVYANNRLAAVIGRQPADTLDGQLDVLTDDHRAALHALVDATLADGPDRDLDVHLRPRDAGAEERICAVSVRALRDDGGVTGAVLCFSDITDATTLRRELEHEARYDRLTGCWNRAATMAALEQALAGEREAAEGIAVLFVDLDRFKPINDERGHAAGDRVLSVVADRLRHAVRDGDVVGRMGGDEFLVVCPGTDRATGDRIAARINAAFDEPVDLDHGPVPIGASVGIVWSAEPGLTADAIVARADAAMYECKRARHGGVPGRSA